MNESPQSLLIEISKYINVDINKCELIIEKAKNEPVYDVIVQYLTKKEKDIRTIVDAKYKFPEIKLKEKKLRFEEMGLTSLFNTLTNLLLK